jgi:hypothetical protein
MTEDKKVKLIKFLVLLISVGIVLKLVDLIRIVINAF